MTARRGWSWLALPLLCLPGTVAASPYCHSCAEGGEAIADATRAFTAEVVSFDSHHWTAEVKVDEVFLGDVAEETVTLGPNPMSSCHPKHLEIGSRWLVLAGEAVKLPTCTRALVSLDDDGAAELLASLQPLLADHERWARADADALIAAFEGAGSETREAMQARVATRDDPQAEAFWTKRLETDPSTVLITAGADGLVAAASDETLRGLVSTLGAHPFSDEIILRALERRRPAGGEAIADALLAEVSLSPELRGKLCDAVAQASELDDARRAALQSACPALALPADAQVPPAPESP